MKDFLLALDIPVPRQYPYGAFHIIFMLVAFPTVFFLAWKLRNLSEETGRRMLIGIGIAMVLGEIYTQLFSHFVVTPDAYDWAIFPFHMCSIPLYFLLIAPFLKKGKVRSGMYHFMMIYNLMGGFTAFFEPSGLMHDYFILTILSFLWHLLLVFVGLYLGFSDQCEKRMCDFRYASVTLLILCGLAFLLNLAFYKVSEGHLNMFFVGPRKTPIIVFKQIAEACGWYVATIVYIIAILIGGFVIFMPFHRYGQHRAEARNKDMISE
ncbi:MAG: YwaF family protein [Lachnospiraceae bacterium]|nr:YwaF family protein [Lachnospiraceae bacterium]